MPIETLQSPFLAQAFPWKPTNTFSEIVGCFSDYKLIFTRNPCVPAPSLLDLVKRVTVTWASEITPSPGGSPSGTRFVPHRQGGSRQGTMRVLAWTRLRLGSLARTASHCFFARIQSEFDVSAQKRSSGFKFKL